MTGCGDDDSSQVPTSPTTIQPPTATTSANRAPQTSGSIPAQILTVGGDPTLVDVAPYFSDPDGGALTYTAMSSDADTVTAAVSGSIVALTAIAAGPASVTVTATDSGNLTATQMLRYRATWEALAPTTTWRGLMVADENRCSSYDPDDYSYPQWVEDDIVEQLGGIYSPYTCETFGSTRETDIEHIVARSEAPRQRVVRRGHRDAGAVRAGPAESHPGQSGPEPERETRPRTPPSGSRTRTPAGSHRPSSTCVWPTG